MSSTRKNIDKIKRLLKWHQRGITISDLASDMKINRNLVAKYLDMLLISGQVEMQVIGAAKVYFLSRRVPVSALLEFSSDLVVVVDNDGEILQINEQVPLLIEGTKEALTGKRLGEFENPFMNALHLSTARKPHEKGESVADLDCLLNGEARHFRSKLVPTAFEDGSDGITFIVEDVTNPEKVRGDAPDKRGTRYRGLVQSSGEAIIGNDPEGNIISWNAAAERLWGYRESEVLGRPLNILVPSMGQNGCFEYPEQGSQGR